MAGSDRPGITREQAVAQMAESFVVHYLHVERGLLPLDKVAPVMDWRVRQMHPPIRPRPSPQPVSPRDYGRLRVSMPTPNKAHVSVVARDPQGQWRALVLELQYGERLLDDRKTWMVTELTRLEREYEPRLVHRAQRFDTPEPKRKPGPDAVRQQAGERSFARTALSAVEAQLERHRQTADPEHIEALRCDVAKWRAHVQSLDQEVAQLRGRRSLRDGLRYIEPPAAVPSPLATLLGDPPQEDELALDTWRRAAGLIEGFHERWDVREVTPPLGPEAVSEVQRLDRDSLQQELHRLGFALPDREVDVEPPGFALD
ncbi:hypothetical protein BH20ACT9_BH20ACT9_07340 [soil metagenome]